MRQQIVCETMHGKHSVSGKWTWVKASVLLPHWIGIVQYLALTLMDAQDLMPSFALTCLAFSPFLCEGQLGLCN